MSALHWKKILRKNFTHLSDLLAFLEFSESNKEKILKKPAFICNVPKRLAEKMPKNSLDHPLVRQFLPLKEEEEKNPFFVSDPVNEKLFRKEPKLIHKYHGRVLLLCTSSCAMHCRYCFRQNFPYENKEKGFIEEITYISHDSSIKEVILSGGDPLSLDDDVLFSLLHSLYQIPHIEKIRFHTRLLSGIPERIDSSFLTSLEALPFAPIFVFHINHLLELDKEFFEKTNHLKKLGCLLLSQTVLLKGVNDNFTALSSLFETLSSNGILPYYLHQLDKVKGTKHFEVDEETGKKLMQELQNKLPGYAVPKYVKEIPGMASKTIIF